MSASPTRSDGSCPCTPTDGHPWYRKDEQCTQARPPSALANSDRPGLASGDGRERIPSLARLHGTRTADAAGWPSIVGSGAPLPETRRPRRGRGSAPVRWNGAELWSPVPIAAGASVRVLRAAVWSRFNQLINYNPGQARRGWSRQGAPRRRARSHRGPVTAEQQTPLDSPRRPWRGSAVVVEVAKPEDQCGDGT